MRSQLKERPASAREVIEPGVQAGRPKSPTHKKALIRVSLPHELCDLLDSKRGELNRSEYIERCLWWLCS